MHRIFIYGTLKAGARNHAYLEGAQFAGEVKTAEAAFTMFAAANHA